MSLSLEVAEALLATGWAWSSELSESLWLLRAEKRFEAALRDSEKAALVAFAETFEDAALRGDLLPTRADSRRLLDYFRARREKEFRGAMFG